MSTEERKTAVPKKRVSIALPDSDPSQSQNSQITPQIDISGSASDIPQSSDAENKATPTTEVVTSSDVPQLDKLGVTRSTTSGSRRSSMKPTGENLLRSATCATPKSAAQLSLGAASVAPTLARNAIVKTVPLQPAASMGQVTNGGGSAMFQAAGSTMSINSVATGYVNPLFQDSDAPIVKKPKINKEKRMSLGAALCIPPPPRIDNNMNFKKVFMLSMGAIGMVYGDIGVSPIFVLKTIFSTFIIEGGEHGGHTIDTSVVNETVILGSISFLIWVITLVCCVKYIIFVLKADKNGEGGTWALVSLLPLDNEDHVLFKYRVYIFNLAIVGASCLLADGFIAPAICVLSAFEGVQDYSEGHLPRQGTIALACIVLFILFMLQRFGTSKSLKFYGPIMLLWFLVIAGVGLYNITLNYTVLKAFSPHMIVNLFTSNSNNAFGLAVTGVEAMYADLGHFKTLPIRVSFLAIVYPAIICSYLGQGAYLINNPDAGSHPFFNSVPQPMKYVVLVLATFAAIIASQATISGCFTLIDQGISLRVFPNIKTTHTTAAHAGDAGSVYIPAFNNALMCGSIILVLSFGSSEAIAEIFGIGVTITMTCTTLFYILAMKYVWHQPDWQTYLFSFCFIILDVFLFFASCRKFASYGWIAILMSFCMFYMMYTWYTTNKEISDKLHERLLELNELRIHVKHIHRTQGTVVFVSNTDEDVPNVLRICAQQLRSLPANIVCMTAISSTAPFIAEEERVVFRTVDPVAGIYRLVISYGYAERSIDTVTAVERARKRGLRIGAEERPTFVVGRELVSTKKDEKDFIKKFRVLSYSAISSNTEGKIEYFNLPAKDTLEIGAQMLL
ncbi:hypothetical protein BCR33DRAFT_785291 [Rhizoclosmatium globosum]|uniref:Potassium transporter n=1 Tax=Rhizoclosmatium globosum TaxID=329046 RepID=A0A1Y2CAI5_9FUNG|nr:hypothetical protein BCR33DRAFT_785291 [Rhizoclosmatium globosum]|eukprot:ORY44041.1 hypothetical protein BCR33DRAFT_785291 [Rhizoclosmatium globosum]